MKRIFFGFREWKNHLTSKYFFASTFWDSISSSYSICQSPWAICWIYLANTLYLKTRIEVLIEKVSFTHKKTPSIYFFNDFGSMEYAATRFVGAHFYGFGRFFRVCLKRGVNL